MTQGQDLFTGLAIEQVANHKFDLDLNVEQIVAESLPLSRMATASLFFDQHKRLYVLIQSETSMLLSDVKKMLVKMGVLAAEYFPPQGERDFFDVIATKHFQKVFPGRPVTSDSDLAYYRTLAPYNPALIEVAAVKNSTIYGYDPDSADQWRAVCHLSYRKINPAST